MRRNYDTKLSATHNYEEKLSQEIIRKNYDRNYQLVYNDAKNVEIIGILAYLKTVCL